MSAFIVDHAHIDVMIDVAKQFAGAPYCRLRWVHANPMRMTRIDEVDETILGRMLLSENARSVADRYREGQHPVALTYRYRRTHRIFTPAEALKAVDCYRYQSCEHDDWKESEACAFSEALYRQIVRLAIPQCDDDPWAWTDAQLGRASSIPA